MRLYGNLNNRFDEGKNYNKDKLIHENDDITIYYYSDRSCYFVTKVVDQKNIFVHRYEVCADREKEGGQGHQNWKYFKTTAEENRYLNTFHIKGLNGEEYHYDENPVEPDDEEWTFRYNHWYRVSRWNKENTKAERAIDRFYLPEFTEKEQKALYEGKEVVKYSRISEGISFGVRDYYYDWSF